MYWNDDDDYQIGLLDVVVPFDERLMVCDDQHSYLSLCHHDIMMSSVHDDAAADDDVEDDDTNEVDNFIRS